MTSPEWVLHQALEAYNRRDWAATIDLAGKLLGLSPRQPRLHYMVGIACLELHSIAPAVRHLAEAASLDPANPAFLSQYARALAIARQTGEALRVARHALTFNSQDVGTLDTLGVVCAQANSHEQASMAFRRAVALMPNQAHLRFNLATSLVFTGDLDAAEKELEACIALDECHWNAHLSLSRLRHQTRENNHLERLEALRNRYAGHGHAQLYLNLALAKEHEDLREFPAAFACLSRGKGAGRSLRSYDARRDAALFESVKAAFPRAPAEIAGDASREPIFVIGMPRTGTTLVDRILGSHPDVYSAGELQSMSMAAKRASGSTTPFLLDPDTLRRTATIDWKALGADYLSRTRPTTGHTLRFVDKLPHNFLYIGYIVRALPNAKIICLRRNPLDTCLSNFRQLFALTSPYYDYSFDLLDTGRYFVLFDALMTHWRQTLAGRFLEVSYESLVDNQEAVIRALLDHCGLGWHEACLHFEDNPAPVATASAVQVRAPIYRSALARWRNYENELGGLRELLEKAGVDPFAH
ncbi:MAG TPA: sulfotransferase [Rhodanobacter sp.]|nr:sulfotransferase [Rhodanobacter sp.]